ncbi:MAG: formylglycine-generating enzyme family protein, partial [Planctomycetota bacterium]|nr:formylglycine-generating enzyme family protein [Planctomycetota bacterium]
MLCGRLNTALSGEIVEIKLGDLASMKFVQIPAGTFMMGSPESEAGRYGIEEIQHEVTISKPFYLGICEVTQAQYEAVVGNNPSQYKGNGGTKPVESVSWDDAREFCRKASDLAGKRFRLPTEAEWEYACRAGTATPFSTGETLSPKQASLIDAKNRETLAAGSFPPNAWGLHDMHGNVWEWCSDWYGAYATGKQTDPQGTP